MLKWCADKAVCLLLSVKICFVSRQHIVCDLILDKWIKLLEDQNLESTGTPWSDGRVKCKKKFFCPVIITNFRPKWLKSNEGLCEGVSHSLPSPSGGGGGGEAKTNIYILLQWNYSTEIFKQLASRFERKYWQINYCFYTKMVWISRFAYPYSPLSSKITQYTMA